MAIQIKRDQLEKSGARIHDIKPPLKPLVKQEGNAVVMKVTDYELIAATNEHRQATLASLSLLGTQLTSALSALKTPEGWTGNWDVHIKGRDALGRISEVQFKPSKA